MPLLEPVKANFGTDGNKHLDQFVFSNLTALINSYRSLHTSKLPEWRRLTKGQPREKTRSFPWEGASNTIVQLIGENVDVIKAVQLGTIYEILPLWTAGLVGDWPIESKGEEQRSVVERFLDQMGLSKTELDLYRVESKAAHDIASLGSVLIKCPWETRVQNIVTGIDDSGKFTESEETLYDGPRPEKLAYEDWMATPTAQTWEEAKFKVHQYRITKSECEYKVYKGHFDKDAWEKIKDKPDILGLTPEEEEKVAQQNLEAGGYQDKELARWRFYECWLEYQCDNKKYSIIYTMHLDPQLRMSAWFNFYPKNEEPFEFGRLGFSEDGLIGYGFAEMGEMYQEESSTTHNQRMDNRTLLNTSVLIGGNNPRIDAGISLFPMAVLPFNKDEVDIRSLGAKADSSVPEEQLTIALAKARFGTDMMSAEGNGSGTVGKKGYSSMGTFSIMQQGARRINVNITDFRFLHLNLGQKCLRQYAYFGVGDNRVKYYGESGKYLTMAMNAIKEGRIELPIKAATASINKEIEKQTGMLFVQVMQRHYGAIAQILQGVSNPVIPTEVKEFLIGSIGGMAYVMGKLARAFGYDDVSRMQPELKIIDKILKQQSQQSQQGANSNGQQSVPNNEGATPPSDGRSSIQEGEGSSANSGNTSGAPGPQATGGILHG